MPTLVVGQRSPPRTVSLQKVSSMGRGPLELVDGPVLGAPVCGLKVVVVVMGDGGLLGAGGVVVVSTKSTCKHIFHYQNEPHSVTYMLQL